MLYNNNDNNYAKTPDKYDLNENGWYHEMCFSIIITLMKS